MSTATLPVPIAPPTPPPAVPLLNADEFARRYANHYVELVDGYVVEVPVPFPKHGKVCYRAARVFGNFVDDRDLGHIMTNDSFVQTKADPDRVRGADVCFFSYARLPKGEVPEGLLPVAPDLIVEVRSPSDAWTAVFTKVVEYLTSGVRVVIVLDPATRSASVYRNGTRQEVFEADRELTVPDVLPGFACPVGPLFD